MSKRRMIYVVPLENLIVRIPNTKAKLPPKGGWVPAENYWLRRISDGSVREAEPPEVETEGPKIDMPKREFGVSVKVKEIKGKHKED